MIPLSTHKIVHIYKRQPVTSSKQKSIQKLHVELLPEHLGPKNLFACLIAGGYRRTRTVRGQLPYERREGGKLICLTGRLASTSAQQATMIFSLAARWTVHHPFSSTFQDMIICSVSTCPKHDETPSSLLVLGRILFLRKLRHILL